MYLAKRYVTVFIYTSPFCRHFQVIPDPVASLDLSDVENLHANYLKCLENITGAVSSDIAFTLAEVGKKEKVIPVTKGKDPTPDGAFAFEVTDGESRLTVVCDIYQLWMRGIVNGNGRYELKMPGPKAMDDSKSLHTKGSYPDLLGGSVDVCVVGYQSLVNAFYTLIAYCENTDQHKAAIAVILVMFFEASRFQELRDLSYRLLRDKYNEAVGGTNRVLINNWYDMSIEFYEESGAPQPKRVISIVESTGVATKKVAKSVLILCRSAWDDWVEEKFAAVDPRKTGSSRR
jgi:hypothetical protein